MKSNMYATIRRYENVAYPDDASKAVDEIFVPLISNLHGFIEYFWINLGNGAMMSITIFETLADAIEANEQSKGWIREHLSSVLSPSIRVEAGKIMTYKGNPKATA